MRIGTRGRPRGPESGSAAEGVAHDRDRGDRLEVDDAAPKGRICVLDWETAAYGPGVIDLAALIAGRWSSEDRDAMVAAYRRALTHARRPAGTVDRLEESLLHARLHLAVQQLGWAGGWSPPAEQAHDWLQEAMELAEQLSL